jgi:hypothetical protein
MDSSNRICPGRSVLLLHSFALFFLTISAPQSLRDVTLFLNTPLPDPSVSLSIFFALPPFADFRFIGSVNNVSPSASVRLRLQPGDGQPTALQIAVLMEATATTEQRNAQLQARAHSSQLFFFVVCKRLNRKSLTFGRRETSSRNSGAALRWTSCDIASRFR